MPERVAATRICNVEIYNYIKFKLSIQNFTYKYLYIHFDDVSCTIKAKYLSFCHFGKFHNPRGWGYLTGSIKTTNRLKAMNIFVNESRIMQANISKGTTILTFANFIQNIIFRIIITKIESRKSYFVIDFMANSDLNIFQP